MPDHTALEVVERTLPGLRVVDAGNIGEVTFGDPEDLEPGVLVAEHSHDLPLDEGRHALDLGHRTEPIGQPVVILDHPADPSVLVLVGLAVDRDMGIRAEDRRDELVPEPRPHGERDDERGDGERDPDERNPGHHADTALGPLGTQIAPSDQELVAGKGRWCRHVCSGFASLWRVWPAGSTHQSVQSRIGNAARIARSVLGSSAARLGSNGMRGR